MRIKRYGLLLIVALIVLAMIPMAAYAAPTVKCATIQGGEITDSVGNPLTVGFDEFGYNYQAHLFAGSYDGFDRVWGNDPNDYADDYLVMKWSDDWLSNQDCDGDGKLDRGTQGDNVSQGWLTNHFVGDYDSNGDGIQDAKWSEFIKIVWTGPGSPLWGQYTVILDVWNDPAGGLHGVFEKIGAPGFGLNDGWTTIP